MKAFWKLKRKDYFSVAMDLKRVLPELKGLLAEDIEARLHKTDLEFYQETKVKAPFLIRLTLPFSFLTVVILFILMPFKYIITGKWGYEWVPLTNWLRSLGL